MMRNFWQGLFWGSFIGIMLGTVISPIMNQSTFRKKPFVERSADSIVSTTHGLMRKARKRLLHKFD